MLKPQKTMPNIAILTWERLINPESCTPEREITLADLKEKQCRGNTLKKVTINNTNLYLIKTTCIIAAAQIAHPSKFLNFPTKLIKYHSQLD